MKEIKFRAWVANNIIENRSAEIYEVSKLDWNDDGIVCGELFSPITQTFHILDAEWFELESFTGLHDHHDIPIYEGDQDKDGGVIEWNDDDASFIVTYADLETQSIESAKDWFVVAGNKHENPELVKESEIQDEKS